MRLSIPFTGLFTAYARLPWVVVEVRPDGVAEVRDDVACVERRLETDGPMLRHGLQEVHGRRLLLPRAEEKRPSVEGLEWRYERFRERTG